jgi:hypothetical protein
MFQSVGCDASICSRRQSEGIGTIDRPVSRAKSPIDDLKYDKPGWNALALQKTGSLLRASAIGVDRGIANTLIYVTGEGSC